MNYTYVVFGAGRMGRAVAWHLVSDSTTNIVVLVDTDARALSDLKSEFVAAGFGHKIDLCHNDNTTLDMLTLRDIDVCIATCGYKHYEYLTKACIIAGANMIDLGGNREVVEAQKLLDRDAVNSGVTIIPDCGLAPGMIGILGMHAFNVLFDQGCGNINVNMRVGGLPRHPGTLDENPLQYELTWSADGLINEYDIPADALRDGKLIKLPALSECENVVIPTPWNSNEYEAFVTGGGSSNLPSILSQQARNVDYKTLRYRGHNTIMRGIQRLGFFSDPDLRSSLLSALNKNLTSITDDDVVIAHVGAKGVYASDEMSSIELSVFCTRDNERMFSAMAQTTGFSAAIVAQMIADGTIKDLGVIDGELAVPSEQYIKRLKESRINVQVSAK